MGNGFDEGPGADGYPWEVRLPESTKRGLGGPRPRATLIHGGGERPLPLGLARALIRARDEGWRPPDREGFLSELAAREGDAAWEELVQTLNRRDLTAREAVERLTREGFDPAVGEAVAERARELRLIDDRRYADTFTRQRIARGWGRLRIQRELEQRGISVDDLEGWAEDHFEGEGEAERARALLARRSVPAKNPYERLVRFLVSRGFDYATAKAAARERIDEDG